MKKKALFAVLLLFAATLCFAERRTRVDTYKNYTFKLIWNDMRADPPDDVNAKKGYNDSIASWKSVIVYLYYLGGFSWVEDGAIAAKVELYEAPTGMYRLVIGRYIEGIWETEFRQDYYNYNEARRVFKEATDRFESAVWW